MKLSHLFSPPRPPKQSSRWMQVWQTTFWPMLIGVVIGLLSTLILKFLGKGLKF